MRSFVNVFMHKDSIGELEKSITWKIIQEDVKTVFFLVSNVQDSVFCMMMLPYYALFIQSYQEFTGELFVDDKVAIYLKNFRNYLKAYEEGFGKTRKRVRSVDVKQNELFQSKLHFIFLRRWKIHYNLGTYWTKDRNIIGNTQMISDFLGVQSYGPSFNKCLFEVSIQMGKSIKHAYETFDNSTKSDVLKRESEKTPIIYYCDLNTDRNTGFFMENDKEISLFFLNLLCSMNFVKYVLRPMFNDNYWIFRCEYITTYYAYKALQRLKNYCDNNKGLEVNGITRLRLIDIDDSLFLTKFRNCMMHYNLEGAEVLSKQYIEKPFFGMIESCFSGLSFEDYYTKLRKAADVLIEYLTGCFDVESIKLKCL